MTRNTSFQTIPADGEWLRVIVVGAGGMGRAWIQTIEANNGAQIVGIVDVNEAAARSAAEQLGKPELLTGTDAVDVARRSGAQAIIDVTIPEAHHPVTIAALLAGYPVLGEKPVAATVAEGLSLAAAAQLTGQLFMVSQSRRYNRNLHEAKQQLQTLGRIGIVSVDFYKSVHFGGFRDEMASPLLLDMAIHQFDMARYLLDADPVSVSCEEFNPPWSWYRGDAAASAVFEMDNGARFVFNGSWCSPGLETSWNGAWRVSAEAGTVIWDGDNRPQAEPAPDGVARVADAEEEIAGSLQEFILALRTGAEPMGRVHANVLSFAMVEAAIQSARTCQLVTLDSVLEESYRAALSSEQNQDVLEVLKSWTDVRSALNDATDGGAA